MNSERSSVAEVKIQQTTTNKTTTAPHKTTIQKGLLAWGRITSRFRHFIYYIMYARKQIAYL